MSVLYCRIYQLHVAVPLILDLLQYISIRKKLPRGMNKMIIYSSRRSQRLMKHKKLCLDVRDSELVSEWRRRRVGGGMKSGLQPLTN